MPARARSTRPGARSLTGIVVHVVAWRCAIVVWRHIVISELHQAEEFHGERRKAAIARIQSDAEAVRSARLRAA